ncbi:hypothetical protein EV426DRAFT_616414 [Tirmania nivea]|nr:hypothetical protein EV426DRAFT_616414 [Tirmania nivea]
MYYIVIPYDYFLIMLIPIMDTCYPFKDFCIISFTYPLPLHYAISYYLRLVFIYISCHDSSTIR